MARDFCKRFARRLALRLWLWTAEERLTGQHERFGVEHRKQIEEQGRGGEGLLCVQCRSVVVLI